MSKTTRSLLIAVLGLGLTTAACGDDGDGGTTPDAAAVDGATVDGSDVDGAAGIALTSVTGTFVSPESAHWDSTNKVWYVSSFGQAFDLTGMTPDAPGYISRIGADGTVIDAKWVEMDGDFIGMAAMDGTLYVSHGSDLIEVDIAAGTTNAVAVPGAMSLNDVAVGGGKVYISDTVANTIFSYTPGGTPEVFSTDAMLVAPNGVYVDGDTVLVGTLGAFPPDPATPGGLYQLDSAGAATRLGTVSGLFDGIEKAGDSYLVSDFGGKIYLVMLGALIKDPSASSDLPALARAELVALKEAIDKRASDAADDATITTHLHDLSARIEAALDPRAR